MTRANRWTLRRCLFLFNDQPSEPYTCKSPAPEGGVKLNPGRMHGDINHARGVNQTDPLPAFIRAPFRIAQVPILVIQALLISRAVVTFILDQSTLPRLLGEGIAHTVEISNHDDIDLAIVRRTDFAQILLAARSSSSLKLYGYSS
jgi:hypothetical protein